MNNKAEGAGKFIFILFVIMIIVAVFFWFFGDLIPQTKVFHERITTLFKSNQSITILPNTTQQLAIVNPGWCIAKTFTLNTYDRESPVAQQILGWDSTVGACVMQYFGFSQCLQKDIYLKYSYTAEVGGEIKYVKVNDIEVDKTLYKEYILDIDRESILNKPCDSRLYNGVVIP